MRMYLKKEAVNTGRHGGTGKRHHILPFPAGNTLPGAGKLKTVRGIIKHGISGLSHFDQTPKINNKIVIAEA